MSKEDSKNNVTFMGINLGDVEVNPDYKREKTTLKPTPIPTQEELSTHLDNTIPGLDNSITEDARKTVQPEPQAKEQAAPAPKGFFEMIKEAFAGNNNNEATVEKARRVGGRFDKNNNGINDRTEARMARRMTRDADRDGIPDVVEKQMRVARMRDRDGDGIPDAKERQQARARNKADEMGKEPANNELAQALDTGVKGGYARTRGDGKVSQGEINKAMSDPDKAQKIAKAMDLNDDGEVTQGEATKAMKQAGLKVAGSFSTQDRAYELAALNVGKALKQAGVNMKDIDAPLGPPGEQAKQLVFSPQPPAPKETGRG